MIKQPLDPKKEHLLKTIVTEYIHTASPVASLVLGGHYGLEASTATLRNWMSDLETLGFLKQPHPSSGRIPTDQGYRHYVDLLMEKENLPAKERRLVNRELEAGFREIEDLLEQAADIIAHISHCTALIIPPPEQPFVVKSLRLVPLDSGRALLVVLSQSGWVLDRVIDLDCPQSRLETLAAILSERLCGRSPSQIGPHALDGIADDMIAELFAKIANLISDSIAEENKNRLLVEGTHHLLDHPEFRDLEKFKNALETFKQESRLCRFLGRLGTGAELRIVIGVENPLKNFQELSVIATPYAAGPQGFGTLALVGPTRMDYSRLVPLVEYAASVLSARLENRIA